MAAGHRWYVPASSVGGAVATLPIPGVSGKAVPATHRVEIHDEVTALFDDLREPILRYLLSMGLSVADGEDVVQETFLALFRHLHRGRPRTNLRGWIFRTAHNLGLKSRRLDGLARRTIRTPPFADPVADGAPNPEQRLRMRQRYERMCAVLSALPARDRSCLSLRAEGLRYREIARVLGVSLGTVSNCMRRAASRLQNVQA
ncbi:MAG: RNA polymerase sigma factor [Acidobacteriia bacterium]|nr:RNA polymerase sigma factor [Terriglobia bacterium]